MTTVDKVISHKIANASIVCALVVVLIHTNTVAPEGSAAWWVHSMISKGVGRMAVPFFFAVSGFLMAGHFNDVGWWYNENRKRLRSLLVPYLLWSTLFIMMIVGMRVLSNVAAHRPLFDAEVWNVWYFLKAYGVTFDEPMHGALWYVRGLIVVVLLSPVVRLVLRFGAAGVLLMFIFELVYYRYLPSMKLHPFSCLIPSVGFSYFTLGAYLRQSNWQGGGLPVWAGWLCILCGVILAFLRNWFWLRGYGGWPEYFTFISTLILCAGLWSIIPDRSWPKWLVSMSFPIYCIHFFVDFPLFFVPETMWIKCTTAGWFVRASYIFLGSVALVALLRKAAPQVMKVFCGGR